MNSLWFVQLPAFKRPSHRKILWCRHFSQLAEKKAVKAVKAVSARKLSSPSTPASPPSPPLPPVVLIKCQFFSLSHLSRCSDKKRHIDLTVSHHPPHLLHLLYRLFPGRFEKLSVFSRLALSPRREKSLQPHHGPRHTPSANDTAGHSCR